MQKGWVKLYGEWYYFNDSGVRQVGWLKDGGYWYYLNSDGIMQTGWLRLYGEWYYFNADGVRQVGWLTDNGKTYYLNSDGIMQISWQEIPKGSGKHYHFNAEGVMDTGWREIPSGTWYYFNSKGIMQTGWLKYNNKWYYLQSDGVMRTASITIGTRYYEFNSGGDMYKTELLINRQTQQMSNWCWAASSVMIGTYNTSHTVTQEDVVIEVKGSRVDWAGSESDEEQAINFASNNSKIADGEDFFSSFNSAVNEIDNNRPYLVRMSWNSGGGHAVVCAGYNSNTNEIRIIDPGRDCETRYYNYDAFRTRITLRSGTGRTRGIVTFEYR